MAEPPSIDRIKKAYQDDEINARQYHQALWQLSRQSFEDRVLYSGSTIGAVKAAMGQVWDDWRQRYQEIQQSEKSQQIRQQAEAEMKKTGKMPEEIFQTPEGFGERMLKDLDAAFSPISRTAQLSGNGWKQMIKAVGAPDWFAKMVGYGVETAATFVLSGKPIAQAQAGLATDVSAGVKAIKGLMAAKVGSTATAAAPKAAEAAAALPTEIAPLVEQAISDISKYDNPLQVALVNFSKDSAKQARGMAENVERGGLRRVTHEVTMQRAAALPDKSLADIAQIAPGTTLNAEQLVKAQAAFKEPMQQLLEIAPKVAAGDPDSFLAFDALNHRMLNPTASLEAIKTESGRATEILKATTPIHEQIANLHDIYAGFGPEAAAAGNWDSARSSLAAKIMELGNVGDVQNWYETALTNTRGEKGKTVGDIARQAYSAVLLAKPATWVKKTLGDIQGAFDKTLQYGFGGYLSPDDKGLLNSEGPLAARVMLQSLMHNMGFSGGEFGPAFDMATKSKDIPAAMAEFVGSGKARSMSGFFDYGGDPERWNVPGRVFDNITSFAQNTASTFAQYMAAHREGIKAGFDGSALNEFVSQRMANPNKEMLLEAIDAGGQVTYTNPMGGLGHAVQKAVQGWGPAWLITPFFHVPANLVNRAFSNIPVVSLFTNGVVKDLESGGVARDLQLGRLGMAQMSSQMLWLMAKGGLLTGHGPNDPKERQVWMENGNKPYSFHFGNTYIPYGFLGSLGIQASVIADTAYMSDYFDQPSLENVAGATLISGARAIANEPFFESWGRLSSAMQDPEKSGIRALGDGLEKMAMTPATVLTGGPLVATAARALNPFSKSVDNILDDIKQNIPVLRDGVPNRLNPLTGEREQLPAPWGTGWLRDHQTALGRVPEAITGEINPMSSYDVPNSKDPVIREMQRAGASFPNFRVNYGTQPSLSGAAPEPGQAPPVNLTAAESEQLIKQFATRKFDGEKTVKEFLQDQINDPNYASMPRSAKQQMFDGVLRGNNAQAFEEFKAKHPDVAYRYAVSGLQKILSATNPEDRQNLEQEYLRGYNEAAQMYDNENQQLMLDNADKEQQIYNNTQSQDVAAPQEGVPSE